MASATSGARTWRCLACGSVYADPRRDGLRYHHVCTLLGETRVDRRFRPGHRDETIVQLWPGGPVTINAAGAGRALLAEEDLVWNAPLEAYLALADRPPIGPVPYPEEQRAEHPAAGRPARGG